jgi:hypothetical protein
MSTLVAEIYGDKDVSYGQLITGAGHVKTIMAAEPFVTDIDDSTEADRERIDFVVDKEKGRPARGLHPADHRDPAHRPVRRHPGHAAPAQGAPDPEDQAPSCPGQALR